MKNFRDSNGTEWTVFEVRRQVNGEKAGEWSYLPKGYSSGWLCFENKSAKRRLTRYPEGWRELGDEKLGELLAKAAPAPKSSMRFGDDLAEPPTDLHP